jgi:hypothetical protein
MNSSILTPNCSDGVFVELLEMSVVDREGRGLRCTPTTATTFF